MYRLPNKPRSPAPRSIGPVITFLGYGFSETVIIIKQASSNDGWRVRNVFFEGKVNFKLAKALIRFATLSRPIKKAFLKLDYPNFLNQHSFARPTMLLVKSIEA